MFVPIVLYTRSQENFCKQRQQNGKVCIPTYVIEIYALTKKRTLISTRLRQFGDVIPYLLPSL